MILKMFAIRDRATADFGRPMFLVSHGHAIRSFTDEINNPDKDNMMYKHPGDFDLFYLGEYHSEQGTFEAQAPEQIAIGANVAVKADIPPRAKAVN